MSKGKPEHPKIAVIGAGPLGCSITHAALLRGIPVVLEDIIPSNLRRAEAAIRGLLGEQDAAAMAHLEFASTIEAAARQVKVVVEAVPDELESKAEIFSLLDRLALPETLLVTSTARLSVSDLGSITYRGAMIAGIRFAAPVVEQETLTVVGGLETSAEAVQRAVALVQALCRKPVVVRETAEFVAAKIADKAY